MLKRLVIILIISFAAPIYGYLDPGSGSMFLQLLLGGLAGAALLIRLYFKKFIAVITGKKTETPENRETSSKELQEKPH